MTTNPSQKPLWIEHIYKALDDSIIAAAPENRNPYEWMADLLWHSKNERTRYARIKACLDPDQESTNFNPEEMIFILEKEEEVGEIISQSYICDRLNRCLGEKRAPKSAKTILLERQAALVAEQARLQREIDRADAEAALKLVKQ